MTLVFNEPQKGPATHALIVGVEVTDTKGVSAYSAALSARKVADWLFSVDIAGAPLASVALLTSDSRYAPARYVNPRTKRGYRIDPPQIDLVRKEFEQWRQRLESDSGNVACFLFVGPTIEHGRQIHIEIGGFGRKGRGSTVVDFENLWHGMRASKAQRQLYFIDGCISVTGTPEPTAGRLRLMPETKIESRPGPRARYFGAGKATSAESGGNLSLFTAALLETLTDGRKEIQAGALVEPLNARFIRRQAGSDSPPHQIEAEIESDFLLRLNPRQPASAKASDSPSPDPAEADRIAPDLVLLSPRQRDCLRLVHQGLTSAEIAARLGIAAATVDRHIKNAMWTLNVNDRHLAARWLAEWEEGQAKPADRAKPREPNTHFVSDDPEVERDELKRGPLAIALGRRLHRIWCRSNGIAVPGDDPFEAGGDERSAFVLHLDAPWGGGKTSFANFLARVLNPFPRGGSEPAKFLVERAGGAVGTIFIDDPPAGGGEGGAAARWPEDGRRPWIVVPFNAWQAEHCSPPWWTFYQAIRKGCFAAVWSEGRAASRPAQASAPPRPLVEERIWSWAALWTRELLWRLRNPKIVTLLCTFAIALAVTLALTWTKVIFQGDRGPAFDPGTVLGFALAAVTGISGFWSVGALLTESVAPGTDNAAERRSLGGGDPFERFRRHFGRTMAAVRRPVMVIVDDLDRCRPDFVVDLVRGIQTLLRSPRVVFVILGDRDWIERAFEAHHAAMIKVNVGPEQDFGARFVEKAIQMSFILPEMAEPSQDSYVRRVLIGPGAAAAAPEAPAPAPIAQQLRADYREKVASAPTPEARKQAEDALVEQYRPQLEAAAKAKAAEAPASAAPGASDAKATSAAADAQAGKVLSEERALLAAVDDKMGKALLHRLEPLARFFPPNPRQIKRIVNAITMYTAVAYLQMEMDESDERGIELAIWVIIMTEWPKSWRVLASCPPLADVLAADDPKAALAKIEESALPGSREATLKELNRIRADPDLLALITETGDGRPRLTTSSVEQFVRLTPLYSRKQRLVEEAARGETAAAAGKG